MTSKIKKKNLRIIKWLLLVVVVMLLIIPGSLLSTFSILTGNIMNCEKTPFDKNCYCESGSRKIYVPFLGVPKWSCENIEQLLIDPESPTFKEDAIGFAKNYLSTYCNDVCGEIECGDMSPCENGLPPLSKDYCIEAVYGYGSDGNRLANIRCLTKNMAIWEMNFYVESETKTPATTNLLINNNYCYNPQTNKKCTLKEVCEHYDNPEWCVGKLPLTVK